MNVYQKIVGRGLRTVWRMVRKGLEVLPMGDMVGMGMRTTSSYINGIIFTVEMQ